METTYGIISLIPIVVVLFTAIKTKKVITAIVLGSLTGSFIMNGFSFASVWMTGLKEELAYFGDYILIIGLFGVFIKLIEKSGGVEGFSVLCGKFVKSRGASLIVTWLLGIFIFADEYLNALAVGVATRKVTDKFKVSREFLAYVINSTGATVCVLIPISIWGVFVIGQYDILGITVNGSAMAGYLKSLPFVFYGWLAVLAVPLFSLKILPLYGPMKKAEARAMETGDVFPKSYHDRKYDLEETAKEEEKIDGRAINFILPMLVIAIYGIATADILTAVMIANLVCLVMYLSQRIMTFTEFSNHALEGFSEMLYFMALLLFVFNFASVNNLLGITPYVISIVQPVLSPALLPVMSFLIVGLLSVATVSFFGTAAIVFPIVIGLANSMGVNVYLVGGAVVSGIALASHISFFADSAILTCASTEISTDDYAKNIIPLVSGIVIVAAIFYLIAGFIV